MATTLLKEVGINYTTLNNVQEEDLAVLCVTASFINQISLSYPLWHKQN